MVSVDRYVKRRVQLIGIRYAADGKRVCMKTTQSLLKHSKSVCVHASKNSKAALKEHGHCAGRCAMHVRLWRSCIDCK